LKIRLQVSGVVENPAGLAKGKSVVFFDTTWPKYLKTVEKVFQ
jgi:hypothetical protein